MTEIGEDEAVVRSAAAATAELDGQLVALDVELGVCYGLNSVATRIWDAIETPATATAICANLCALYDVDHDTCLAQTRELLGELVDAGLAHRSDRD